MMQSILQNTNTNTPIRLPIGNTGNAYRQLMISPNTIKSVVNHSLFRESMFTRVIPSRPCISCNGAR